MNDLKQETLDSEIFKSTQEYIKSGIYFTDARRWYIQKYLHPILTLILIFTY